MRRQDELFRLSLGTIRCLREVTSSSNTSVAAARLRMSRPVVSQHIARFEKLSGLPVVSGDGKVLHGRPDALAPLLDAVAEVERSISQILDSAVRLRVGISDCLASRYAANVRNLGDLPVDIDIHVSNAARLAQVFQQGGLDVVIGPLPGEPVDADVCATTQLLWIAGNDVPRDTAELPVVLTARDSPYARNAEAALEASNIRYRVMARVDDQLALLQCVANGLGYAAVPEFMIDRLPNTVSVVRNRVPRLAGATIGMMRRKKTPNRSLKRLFDTLLSNAPGVELS